MLRIKEAIQLSNARRMKANEKAGRVPHHKLMNLQKLGMILYEGEYTQAKYKSINVSMHRMTTGAAKSIKLDMVKQLCATLGVDPNFLFGFPSKHDKEFKQL